MLRKIAEIKVPTGAGPREVKTKYVFASYDRQGAAFAFYFSENNIAGTKANLLFVIDGQKVFVDDDVMLSETNETHTFTYPLPDKLLNYTGKVDGYLYFDFEDGSHSDEIHFVFTIKKSQIDEEMEEAPDVYIKSFEDIKADVQSKADQAKKDMQDNVDQVESDYQAWKEQQEKKQEDFEATTDEKVSSITERVGEAENKVTDLERHLDVGQKNYFSTGEVNNLAFLGESAKREIIEDSRYRGYYLPVSSGEVYSISRYSTKNNRFSVGYTETEPKAGTVVFDVVQDDSALKMEGLVVPEKAQYMAFYLSNNNDELPNIMLNKGETSARWVPNANDLVTKSEIEQIKQAITNLGGSI